MEPRPSACSFRPRCSGACLVALAAFGLVVGCKPPAHTRSAADIVVVNAAPRCSKLGVVEGVGRDDPHARENALDLAAERGATHVRLDPAHPDLEDGMTSIVTCTMFRCPSSDEVLPPTGYR
jgi:hypothetical protein